MKKTFFITLATILILLAPYASIAEEQSKTKIKVGLVPSSPFYFIESIGENIITFFSFGEERKVNRLINMAEERIAEAEIMLDRKKPAVAKKLIEKYQILIDKTLLIIEKARDKGKNTDAMMEKITQIILGNETKIANIYEIEPQENNPDIEQAISKQRQKLEIALQKIPDKKKREKLIQDFKKKEEEMRSRFENENTPITSRKPKPSLIEAIEQDNAGNSQGNTYTQEIANPIKDESPTPISADQDWQNGGKPGMNEEGSTQVARPDSSSGNKCSKLYLCKIKCGADIISSCNNQSSQYLYQFLQCRGECTHYNLFYGCGMEQGCDEPCWQSYESSCDTGAYNACLNACEDTFGDCM